MADKSQTTIIPHTQKPLDGSTRTYPKTADLDDLIIQASVAQKSWAKVSLEERIKIGWRMVVSCFGL